MVYGTQITRVIGAFVNQLITRGTHIVDSSNGVVHVGLDVFQSY